MTELKKLSTDKHAYLRHLSMEELLELLTVAPIPAVSPEKEAYVDALKEAIIEKENENPTGFFPDVDQQWEQFIAQYLPDVEDTMLEPEETMRTVSTQTNQHPLEVPQKRVVGLSRIWRMALVAAVAVVCVFGIIFTAQAAGVDVFGVMARWTKEIFSFGLIAPNSEVSDSMDGETTGQDTEDPAPSRQFSSLQEALDAYGIAEIREPKWLPEGYALDEIDAVQFHDSATVALFVTYTDGNDYLGLDIKSYLDEPDMLVQKMDMPVETIEDGEIAFYLIENTSSCIVAWYSDGYEYYINGKLEKEILWKMANSMYQ